MNRKNLILILIIFFLIVLILLVKYNIIFLKAGKVDNLNYNTINVDFEITSPVLDYQENSVFGNSNITFNNAIYKLINSDFINSDLIENYIDEITINTFDEIVNKNITVIGQVYKIKNLSQDTVIAIKFQDKTNYSIYLNSYCKPNTLNDLLEMYNFSEYIQFSDINYIKNIYMKNLGKQEIKLEFSNINLKELNNLLNENSNQKLESYDKNELNQYFIFNTISPLYNSSFHIYLTREMKLIIPIPGIGNYFICNIENVNYNNFIEFIKNEYSKAIVKRILYN